MITHVLVINYNTHNLTKLCLESITKELCEFIDNKRITISLLNNGCKEEEELNFLTKGVTTFTSETNLGFAGGVNFLVNKIRPENNDYLWLVNSDALVSKETYVELLNGIEATPIHSIIGSLVMDSNNEKIYAQGCNTFNWKGYEDYSLSAFNRQLVRVAAPSGASLLIPYAVFVELNGFDEKFFVYVEEMDFCARALSLGYESYVIRSSRIIHEGGASSNSKFKEKMLAKNYSLYVRKNFAPFYWLITIRYIAVNILRLRFRRCYYYFA